MGPRPRGPRGKVKPTKQTFKTLKRLFAYIFENYKYHCFFVALFIIVSSVTNVMGSLFLKSLIDDYIEPMLTQAVPDFMPLLRALITMALIYYFGAFCTWAYARIMISVTQGTLKRIRDEIFEHMESLPIKYFDTHAHGDIMSIYTNDVDTLRQLISQSIPQLISSVITITSVLISMIILSIPMTILTLIFIFIMLAVVKKIGMQSGKFFGQQQKNLGKVNGYIEEMIEGQKVVKVFCREEESCKKFDELNEQLFESAKNANQFANVTGPVTGNLGHISYVFSLVFGSLLAISGFGGFTLGSLVTFLQLNKSFNMPISQVSMQFNSIVMAMAGAERIFALLDEESEPDNGYVTLTNAKIDENGNITETKERTGMWAWRHPHGDGSLTYTKLEGDVVFDGVDFGYNDEKIILHDIKMYANKGQKIAFVGATGAGKTTITNLINRFYDIQDGKIRYDGINLNKIKKADLRRSLGIVLQDTHLFTGTVMENIRFGRLDATDDEVINAAKLANAHDFITLLPKGYDTLLIADGQNLSQGQRQLISIARAAIADPPVLILDEATSSIDTRTEVLVQRGMDSLTKGRTSFVIAHRLSTVRNSDVIMVLDKGRIIERGNHEDLIARKGTYYRLYTGAFELE